MMKDKTNQGGYLLNMLNIPLAKFDIQKVSILCPFCTILCNIVYT